MKKIKEIVVQTILFKRESFGIVRVRNFLNKNNLSSDIDTTTKFFRARQLNPESFNKKTFRTWHIAPGIKAVVGELK